MTANIKYKNLFSWSVIVSYVQMVNDIYHFLSNFGLKFQMNSTHKNIVTSFKF